MRINQWEIYVSIDKRATFQHCLRLVCVKKCSQWILFTPETLLALITRLDTYFNEFPGGKRQELIYQQIDEIISHLFTMPPIKRRSLGARENLPWKEPLKVKQAFRVFISRAMMMFNSLWNLSW